MCPDVPKSDGAIGTVIYLVSGGNPNDSTQWERPRVQIQAAPGYKVDEMTLEEYAKSHSYIYYENTAVLSEGYITISSGEDMYVSTRIGSYGDNIFYGSGYVYANGMMYELVWHDATGEVNPLLDEIFSSFEFFTPQCESLK